MFLQYKIILSYKLLEIIKTFIIIKNKLMDLGKKTRKKCLARKEYKKVFQFFNHCKNVFNFII